MKLKLGMLTKVGGIEDGIELLKMGLSLEDGDVHTSNRVDIEPGRAQADLPCRPNPVRGGSQAKSSKMTQ